MKSELFQKERERVVDVVEMEIYKTQDFTCEQERILFWGGQAICWEYLKLLSNTKYKALKIYIL